MMGQFDKYTQDLLVIVFFFFFSLNNTQATNSFSLPGEPLAH